MSRVHGSLLLSIPRGFFPVVLVLCYIIIIIIIYRFLERHILKALWRFTILKINNLTNQKTIKSLSKKKGLEAPFECV